MAVVHNPIETLLNEHEVARITGLSVASVRRWRLHRQGPTYVKIGAAARYKAEDIWVWLDSQPFGGVCDELAILRIGMPQREQRTEAGEGQMLVRAGVTLKPPVSLEELKIDTECDPEGAEEFVAFIRALRQESSRPDTL
jgi:hypothetical protein